LTDAGNIGQNELYMKSIVTQIKEYIDSISAVLVVADGTIARVTVGTHYALSTLSAIFPKTLANNTAFVFTKVPSLLFWNFSQDTIPDVFENVPQFLLDNPIALQRKYLQLKDSPIMKKGMANLRNRVKAAEQNALEMLVALFDWLDGLEPHPMTKTIEEVGNIRGV
jgi:hypothetical protein